MRRATKYGEQPIKQVLAARNISLNEFARSTKIPGVHVFNAMNGATPPSKELRVIAPMLLSAHIEQLFTQEVLNVDKEPARGAKPTNACSVCGRKRHTLEQWQECDAARRTDVREDADRGQRAVTG